MNKKLKIILITLSIIFILVIALFIFCTILTGNNSSEQVLAKLENNNILNIVENVIQESHSSNEVNSINQIQNTTIPLSTNEISTNVTTSNEPINEPKDTSIKTEPTIQTKKEEQQNTTKNTKPKIEQNIEQPSQQQNVIEKEETPQNTTKVEEQKVEDNSRPELANTTYRKVNNSIVQEVISILDKEIAKDKELVQFGSKALVGNKTDAYNKTSGFTYLFVKDIEKGKIPGNYESFPQRVKNNVGAFGKYYVYAEDEYTYDSRGLNPKWSQTLVWIYVTF